MEHLAWEIEVSAAEEVFGDTKLIAVPQSFFNFVL